MSHLTVIASDLDRTFIYSRSAYTANDYERQDDVCVEELNGQPFSHITAKAARALESLGQTAFLIPTTTRTLEQMARVVLPGPPSRYVITTNGGHLLVDGLSDPQWADDVARVLAETSHPIDEMWRYLSAACQQPWTLKFTRADNLFCYAVIDRHSVPKLFFSDIAAWCAVRGWATSLQGRKLYFVPTGLTKSAAVGEVVDRHGGGPFIAAGDSLLDAELLLAAEAGMRPAHGELDEQGWNAPHVDITTHQGMVAGQEIAEWFLRRAMERIP
jgi:hypothetical protein